MSKSKKVAVPLPSLGAPLLSQLGSDKRYDDLLSRKAVEEDPNFRWCTNRECSAGQIVENGGPLLHLLISDGF